MQLRENYDWVVLGDHVGSLFGAALAARLGLSVLILPFGKSARSLLSKAGDCLDPEANFLIGLSSEEKKSGLLAKCFSSMGVFPEEKRQIQELRGLPQILGESSRLSFVVSNDALEQELRREFGSELCEKLQMASVLAEVEAGFQQFWRDLPHRLSLPTRLAGQGPRPSLSLRIKKWTKGPRELKRRLLKGTQQSDAARRWLHPTRKVSKLKGVAHQAGLAQYFLGLRYGMTGHPSMDPSSHELMELMSLTRTGGGFLGGMSAFREWGLRLAKRHGAEVGEQVQVQRILIESGRLVGLEVVQGSGKAPVSRKIGARGALLGTSLALAKGQLSIKGKNWWRRLKVAPAPSGWRYTLALRLNSEAIPNGMSSRMIWKEAGSPVLEIETANPSDYGLAETEQEGRGSGSLVFLRTVMPFKAQSLTASYQRRVAARMMRKFIEVVPFSEYHVMKVYPDFRDSSSDETFSKIYGFSSLEEIPANLRCYTGPGLGSRSGIEGLFLTSDESYSDLGIFGGCVAALEAVAWLAHRSGLPGPLA